MSIDSFRAESPGQEGRATLLSPTGVLNLYREPGKIAYNPRVSMVIFGDAFVRTATHAAAGTILRQWRGLMSQQL